MSILSTFHTDLPSPKPIQPAGTGDKIDTIMNWLMYGGLTVCIAGLIIAGAMLAINTRHGEGAQQAGRIGFVLGGVILISAAAALVGALA
jgi:hypothetical protein